MSVIDWVVESKNRIARDGLVSGLTESSYKFYIGAAGRLDWIASGTPIYERDWDVLIILDACRADLMAQSISDYTFLESFETITSVGSTSEEWMEKNFTETYGREMSETVHVTSNLYSESKLDPNAFAELDEVWRYGWDEELRTIPARAVTDRAIHHGRNSDFDRLIVHYMQPHYPFIPNPDIGSGMRADESEPSVWKQLRDGAVTKGTVWDAYKANLHYVLDDLELLLTNLDAERVIVSADHGNSFGKFGIYGHPGGVPLQCLRTVPWVVTEASDSGEYEPEGKEEAIEQSMNERLSALGYAER
ncbi:alkaline phosphatase family protein [Haladaptatus paucihalophilus]|uniref:Sulfatase n=2 Tax=Haladaptatus paucihalophilus DX253 TaxID=797209 RepID=A0A1M6P603_HALPU|nr:hypothetical protein [Haladaptatus paucihalophilus]SHK03330.1 hypothetical protein SAMN05444342_0344 [Haladaptatus paucihalophilus DX253]